MKNIIKNVAATFAIWEITKAFYSVNVHEEYINIKTVSNRFILNIYKDGTFIAFNNPLKMVSYGGIRRKNRILISPYLFDCS